MANPFSLMRKGMEGFVSQWQDYNYGQDMIRRYGPDWRNVMEEQRRFDRATTAAELASKFQQERKFAADAAKSEMDILESLISWESEAFGSEGVYFLRGFVEPGTPEHTSMTKFVREAAEERKRQRELKEDLDIWDMQNKEGNLGMRRIEGALKTGDTKELERQGVDREAIERFLKRQVVSDKEAAVNVRNKEVEVMLDNLRLQREQAVTDYGMAIEDDEERARFFQKSKPDEDQKIFGSAVWGQLAERYADSIAEENGHVDAESGFPAPTEADFREGLRRAAEDAREFERRGATSATKPEGSSHTLQDYRQAREAFSEPAPAQLNRSNSENIVPLGNNASPVPSRQRTSAEHGGMEARRQERNLGYEREIRAYMENSVPFDKWDPRILEYLEGMSSLGR